MPSQDREPRPRRAWLRQGDFWSGLVLAALGTYILAEARRWIYLGEEGPGPGFFPIWYGAAMVVLSLALVLGTVLRSTQAPAVRADASKRRELGRAPLRSSSASAVIFARDGDGCRRNGSKIISVAPAAAAARASSIWNTSAESVKP